MSHIARWVRYEDHVAEVERMSKDWLEVAAQKADKVGRMAQTDDARAAAAEIGKRIRAIEVAER